MPMDRDRLFGEATVKLAKNLAKVDGGASWSQVEMLFNKCPTKNEDGIFILEDRSFAAVSALCVYFVESDFVHKDKIFPYLLELFKNLPTIKPSFMNPTKHVKDVESLAHNLSLMLNHFAVCDQSATTEIDTAHENLLNHLGDLIVHGSESTDDETQAVLTGIIFPVFQGICESMGCTATILSLPTNTDVVEQAVPAKPKPIPTFSPVGIPKSFSAVIGVPLSEIPSRWNAFLQAKLSLPNPPSVTEEKMTWYTGKVHGMLQVDTLENVVNSLVKMLNEPDERVVSEDEYKESLWTAAALAVKCDGPWKKQLEEALYYSPSIRFTVTIAETCVACWREMLSLGDEPRFSASASAIAALLATALSRQGIFRSTPCNDPCDSTPPLAPFVAPHDVLVNFICDVVEEEWARKDEISEVLFYSLQRILPHGIVEDDDKVKLTRHVSAMRPRIRLLRCTLTALQKNKTLPDFTKGLIRHRVYSATLDYYCQPYTCPTQSKEDIVNAVHEISKFWDVVQGDAEFLYSFTLSGVVYGHKEQEYEQKPKGKKGRKAKKAGKKKRDPQSGADEYERVTGLSPKKLDFVNECAEMRKLILQLLAYELDVFTTWHNPRGSKKVKIEGIGNVKKWLKKKTKSIEKLTPEDVPKIFEISPILAVNLPRFLKSKDPEYNEILDAISDNVIQTPEAVIHLPEAIRFLVTPQTVSTDAPALRNMLAWKACSPTRALSLFSREIPSHPYACQYAIRSMQDHPSDSIIFYIPQIVQALRNDGLGYIAHFIKNLSKTSQLVVHQFIWNMLTNTYCDEEGKERDPVIGEVLEDLVKVIVSDLSGEAKEFYEKEFDFFHKITGISGAIRKYPKGPFRNRACLAEIEKISVRKGCYLPSNPEALVLDIDKESATPMQSHAKAPFLARFKVKNCGFHRMEREGLGLRPTGGHAVDIGPEVLQAAIFKVGDDVRQDMLALQIITLFKTAFQKADLDLFLCPYRVVATSPGSGVIECVPNAKSRAQVGKLMNGDLHKYFLKTFGKEDTKEFQDARKHFTMSLAAYSVATYILQIKDRHNGNILIDDQGHIVHIDRHHGRKSKVASLQVLPGSLCAGILGHSALPRLCDNPGNIDAGYETPLLSRKNSRAPQETILSEWIRT